MNNILALIIPCYNEEEIIDITCSKLLEILQELINRGKISEKSFISFVDDGSTDTTWGKIKQLNLKMPNKIKAIKLSKNFGHQYALFAGLIENKADIFISLDSDLQDDISLIEKMVDKYIEGYDIVYGVRNNRDSDTFFKKFTASIFYKITYFMGLKTIPQHADFRLVSNKIVDELKKIKETNLYLRGVIPNIGFKSTCLFYKRKKRIGGTCKYTYLKSLALAIDGVTSFSIIPLRFISFCGLLSFLISLLMTIYALYSFFKHNIVSGWTSLFISIYFIGGIMLLSLGIIGEYIGKIYQETKCRPRYIIEEKLSDNI